MNRFTLAAIGLLFTANAFASTPALVNSSFENTTVGSGYAYGQVAPGWTFAGGSGVSANGTAWYGTTSTGTHFAFLQNTAAISQTFSSTSPYNYTFSFDLALRPYYNLGQQVVVQLDGQQIASAVPMTSWASVTASALNIQAGTHTLTFLGTNPNHAYDTSAFIDNIAMNVTAVPEPETYALLLAGIGCVGAAARRRNKPALA